ncbi:uncharacterized protein LOC115716616 [Cannabis sativa]|uniref:uncharacterized protein LOC115716616 n=1 Tax=Cannabis sativa TaxID=3483 RepID=UPI0029CA7E04|nr:uncharacterized protein LOC115716616 [Cannabis sativa]
MAEKARKNLQQLITFKTSSQKSLTQEEKMAALKSNLHVRSNSLPSKSHPVIEECSGHLLRIGCSDATSSSSSIAHQLSVLEDLHICVEKLLQLPLTQQAFSTGHQEKWVDELVDGSLRLLDLCSAAKDAVLHTKECARDIQSTMRRKVSLENEIKKYSASRKVVKKAIQKALKSLKGVESKYLASTSTKDSETAALVNVLREVEGVTLAAFESLLSFISGPKTQSKLGGWSLVSKLVQSKRVGCDEDVVNEFARVDAVLLTQETNKADQAMLELKNLEMCVQDFEQMLESLFRRLIKTRVSFLNILNN